MKLKLSFIIGLFLITSCNSLDDVELSLNQDSLQNLVDLPNYYSKTSTKLIYKQIVTHFKLKHYKLGNTKLNLLLRKHPELIDSLDLKELSKKFQVKLVELQKKETLAINAEKIRNKYAVEKNLFKLRKNDLTYYKDKSSPRFNTRECIYSYFTKNDSGDLKLYLKIKYVGTEWLDIENFVFKVNQLEYSLNGPITKTETKGKKIYKHEDLNLLIDTPNKLETLNAIANGQHVVAHFIGKTDFKQRPVSKTQKLAIQQVLNAFLYMGGSINEPSGYANTK